MWKIFIDLDHKILSGLIRVNNIAIITQFSVNLPQFTVIFLSLFHRGFIFVYHRFQFGKMRKQSLIFVWIPVRLMLFYSTYSFLKPTLTEIPKWSPNFLSQFLLVLYAFIACKAIATMVGVHLGKWDLKYWGACRNPSNSESIVLIIMIK